MRVFVVSTMFLATSLLCSCSSTEYVKQETVWKDTVIAVPLPGIRVEVPLKVEEVTHVKAPTSLPSQATAQADTCVLPVKLKGKTKGVTVEVEKRDSVWQAIVSVSDDTAHLGVSLPGELTVTQKKSRSWIEALLDDVPPWVVIVGLLLSVSALIYVIKK